MAVVSYSHSESHKARAEVVKVSVLGHHNCWSKTQPATPVVTVVVPSVWLNIPLVQVCYFSYYGLGRNQNKSVLAWQKCERIVLVWWSSCPDCSVLSLPRLCFTKTSFSTVHGKRHVKFRNRKHHVMGIRATTISHTHTRAHTFYF